VVEVVIFKRYQLQTRAQTENDNLSKKKENGPVLTEPLVHQVTLVQWFKEE
jgi:hypothetical protein